MKRCVYFLWLAALVPFLSSCPDKSDEEPDYGDQITFNGVAITVTQAQYSNVAGETTLYLVFGDYDEVLSLTISNARLGKQSTLYASGSSGTWWWEMFFSSFGNGFYEGSAEDMEDIASGTVTCTRVSEGRYSLKLDILFTDNKRLKGQYEGEFTLFSMED